VSDDAVIPRGPFSLSAARDFAGGFPAGLFAHGTDAGLSMAFPVEDWGGSVAADVWQTADGTVHVHLTGPGDPTAARRQVLRSLSLDHDGTDWPAIGQRDPVLGAIQQRYDWLRPVCFYSAYEAATSFVIGQRISMRQARVVKERLAAAHGDPIEMDGGVIRPFPRPQRLLEVTEVVGLAASKVDRIHGLAKAALDGRLDTERLRAMPEAEALAALQVLPGVGPWTAQGILLRGCGVADALPMGDAISRQAVAAFYGLPEPLGDDAWLELAEAWRPYRMWATVLLHMAWRREQGTRA